MLRESTDPAELSESPAKIKWERCWEVNLKDKGWHWEELDFDNEELYPVPIVHDGAISTQEPPLMRKRFVPALVLDTTSRSDLENVIRVHGALGVPGDVSSGWALKPDAPQHSLFLVLRFTQPYSCNALLQFDLLKYGGFVDQIIQVEGLYIFPGRPGERVSILVTKGRESLLIQVSSKEFTPKWERLWNKALREQGLSQQEINDIKNSGEN